MNGALCSIALTHNSSGRLPAPLNFTLGSMKTTIALTILLLSSSLASAVDVAECSGARVKITFSPSSMGRPGVESVLTVSRDEKETALRYDMNIDYIGAECRKNPHGQSLIVFQAYCGGSGCKDLDNFGIIDPSDLRILLVPNDWNRMDAARIFGGTVTAMNNVFSVESGRLIRDIHQR